MLLPSIPMGCGGFEQLDEIRRRKVRLRDARAVSNKAFLETLLDMREKDLVELARVSSKMKDKLDIKYHRYLINSVIFDISNITEVLDGDEADFISFIDSNKIGVICNNHKRLRDIADNIIL